MHAHTCTHAEFREESRLSSGKEQRTAGPEGEGVSVSKQTLGNYAGGEGTVGQLSLNQQCPGFSEVLEHCSEPQR